MESKYVLIVQPDGIDYMIQKVHHNEYYAQEYIDMLIEKMERYIEIKKQGKFIAPLMTLEQMEIQLKNMKQFKIKVLT